MMKKSLILSIVTAASFFVLGCGKDKVPPESFYQYMNKPDASKNPAKHIRDDLSRENRADFSLDGDSEFKTTDFVIEDHAQRFKVKVTSKYVYFVFEHKSSAPNIQFIIDADNSLSTGYKNEGGAEYIVENNKLYKSLKRDVWDWEEVKESDAKIEAVTKIGESDIVRLEKKFFEKKGKFQPFSVGAQALDKNWIPKVISPDNYTKLVVDDTKYSISDTKILASSKYKDQTLGVLKKDNKFEIYISATDYDPYMQIYLDTDLNATTGYKNADIPDFGADYMIEEGILYRANAQSLWGWVYVQPLYVTSWRQEDKIAMKISLEKASVDLLGKDKFNLYLESNNHDWTQTHFLPQDGSFVSVK